MPFPRSSHRLTTRGISLTSRGSGRTPPGTINESMREKSRTRAADTSMTYALSNLVASSSDDRDFVYTPSPGPYPVRCKTLLRYAGTIEKQGSVGICTGTTSTTIAELFLTRAGLPLELAPRFNYDFTRAFEARRGQPGAQLRDAIKTLARWGAPVEALHPSVHDDEVTRDPTFECLLDAAERRLNLYEWITIRGSHWVGVGEIRAHVQSALMERCPLAIAMPVTRSIYDLIGPLEQQVYHVPSEQVPGNDIVGNHAMAGIGYDEYGPILEGSWDSTYGDNGLIRLPWTALENVLDLVVVRRFAGFDSDFHRQFFTDRAASRAQIGAMMAVPQTVIDYAVANELSEYDLECVMEMATGTIASYAASDPVGKTLDWRGFLWT